MDYLQNLDPMILPPIQVGFSLISEFFRRFNRLIISLYILAGTLLWIVLKKTFPVIKDIECPSVLDLLCNVGIFSWSSRRVWELMNTPMKCTARHYHTNTKIRGVSLSWRPNNV